MRGLAGRNRLMGLMGLRGRSWLEMLRGGRRKGRSGWKRKISWIRIPCLLVRDRRIGLLRGQRMSVSSLILVHRYSFVVFLRMSRGGGVRRCLGWTCRGRRDEVDGVERGGIAGS